MDLQEISVTRDELKNLNIDIKERTLIIGFNEPKFKKSKKNLKIGDIDSKLNARMITYFLPAVEIARMQKNRPRYFVMSALNSALKWNAKNDEQKKIMIANNAIKIDFMRTFFDKFFPNDFSLIEYVIPQDILKVPEQTFVDLWNLMESSYFDELKEVKFQLTKFLYPKKFNVKSYDDLTEKQLIKLNEVDTSIAFKYAISHLFVLGDINFEGNYIHTKGGYASIGGEQEAFFNIVRNLAYKVLSKDDGAIFNKDSILFNNLKITFKNKHKALVPYNGMFKGNELLEVTYENSRGLEYYDGQEKLKGQMDYMYENLVSMDDYQEFWNNYKDKYFDLKSRYKEAYNIKNPNW